ncbi:MAG: insulinase family protein, partial [Sediminibacterium sp.]|nr:insulinase family protein [Sediminibacterium sp.]
MKKIYLITVFTCSFCIAFAQLPNRTGPPALDKVKNLSLPTPVRFTLSNGLKVVLMEKHNVPMVQVSLLVATGNYDDPLGKEGLASFVMDALDEGAGNFSALQLSDEIEYLGAQISSVSRPFSSEVNCTAPVARLGQALSLMSTIVLQPSFATAELDRLKKLRLNALLQSYDEPGIIAQRAFSRFLFTEASPYGRFANDRIIQSYVREDLVSFHRSNFVTGNSTLIIAGDITRSTVVPILEKYFATDDLSLIDSKHHQDFINTKNTFFKDLLESGRLNIHYIDFNSENLIEAIYFLHQKNKADIIFVDYMQLLQISDERK